MGNCFKLRGTVCVYVTAVMFRTFRTSRTSRTF